METKGKTNSDTVQEKTYPDKSVFYSFDKAQAVYKEMSGRKILLTDAILLLLYAQPDNPIFGAVSMMKQIFLATHEIFDSDGVQDGRFVPHYYGWYSFLVANDLQNLEFLGFIIRKGKRNTKLEQFQISEKGKQYIKDLFKSLPQDLQTTLKEKRKGWDQLGYRGMLRYMYTKYPESIEKSKLKETYKPIKWGRSKG